MKPKKSAVPPVRWSRGAIEEIEMVRVAPGSLDALTSSAVRGTNSDFDAGDKYIKLEQYGVRADVRIEVSAGSSTVLAAPLAMTMDITDIRNAVHQIALAACQMRESGSIGVQLQAGDGSLLQQFLSPVTNRRSDHWGGSLQNRARLLLMSLNAVREAVGDDFPIGLKLTVRDINDKSTWEKEVMAIVSMLNYAPLDMLELVHWDTEEVRPSGRLDHSAAVQPAHGGAIAISPVELSLQRRIEAVSDSCALRVVVTNGGRCQSRL